MKPLSDEMKRVVHYMLRTGWRTGYSNLNICAGKRCYELIVLASTG